MKKKISIITGNYFPPAIVFLGSLMLLAGLFLIFDYVAISLMLILLSLIIFTTRYRLDIDFNQQFYQDHLWIAGFKKGKKTKYSRIDCLFLKQNRYRQTVNSLISSMTKHGTEYRGYILIDDTDILLCTSDKKARVMKRLENLAKQLKVPMLDYTETRAKEGQ